MDAARLDKIESEAARLRRIAALLARCYPQASTGLRYADPFQLFVAVLL